MLKRVVLAFATIGLAALSWHHVSAQVPVAKPTVSTETRQIRAIRISEPIKIDGRLDEPEWAEAIAATDFRQQEPNEGTPASEKTEARVLFDQESLCRYSRLRFGSCKYQRHGLCPKSSNPGSIVSLSSITLWFTIRNQRRTNGSASEIP